MKNILKFFAVIFAAALIMLSVSSLPASFAGGSYAVGVNTQDDDITEHEPEPGTVRLLTERIYFLERTKIEYVCYDDEIVTYMAIVDDDNKIIEPIYVLDGEYYILIDWTDGLGAEINVVIETNYDVDVYGQLPMYKVKIELVFYGVEFPYRKAGSFYMSGKPIDLSPSIILSQNAADASLTDRLTDNFKNNASVRFRLGGEDISDSVFADGIDWTPGSFYDILRRALSESFDEYSRFDISVEYSVYGYGFLSYFTLINPKQDTAVLDKIGNDIDGMMSDIAYGTQIDGGFIGEAITFDNEILISFDDIKVVCNIFKSETDVSEAEITAYYKGGELDFGEYTFGGGEYRLVFDIYFNGEFFESFGCADNLILKEPEGNGGENNGEGNGSEGGDGEGNSGGEGGGDNPVKQGGDDELPKPDTLAEILLFGGIILVVISLPFAAAFIYSKRIKNLTSLKRPQASDASQGYISKERVDDNGDFAKQNIDINADYGYGDNIGTADGFIDFQTLKEAASADYSADGNVGKLMAKKINGNLPEKDNGAVNAEPNAVAFVDGGASIPENAPNGNTDVKSGNASTKEKFDKLFELHDRLKRK
jgi:hypothetical protein